VRSGGVGYYEQKRGLFAVWGKEAVQFLDGMITNDMKTLPDGGQMIAAFPNAQGRLIAAVRVFRQGERFLIETEEATREKLFQNLFRFTFAGDFFVEDLSEQYRYITIYGRSFVPITPPFIEFDAAGGTDYFFENEDAEDLMSEMANFDAVAVPDEVYEVLRVEHGTPKYGVDMDETTIVPELGNESMISYNKGCYVGQEIIARIHFRGHVAKRLAGLILSAETAAGTELTTTDGKNAGRITSTAFSPRLEKHIALGFVRYDFLAEGTQLRAGDVDVTVKRLPFVD
ncbi:MAG: glycine cleavage T C-terminal barrel domain-containing protein, partial [Pyrinomonadaceae bacterium]|nr:glycine cleavage T C-terminal barrel domain-containing protein [Pyrinomonadaceae bacterium]